MDMELVKIKMSSKIKKYLTNVNDWHILFINRIQKGGVTNERQRDDIRFFIRLSAK